MVGCESRDRVKGEQCTSSYWDIRGAIGLTAYIYLILNMQTFFTPTSCRPVCRIVYIGLEAPDEHHLHAHEWRLCINCLLLYDYRGIINLLMGDGSAGRALAATASLYWWLHRRRISCPFDFTVIVKTKLRISVRIQNTNLMCLPEWPTKYIGQSV